MKKLMSALGATALLSFSVQADNEAVSVAHGTITKLDQGTKTMVVKTKEGTEHVVKVVDKTAVQGAEKTAAGAKDAFKGLSEGSEVVVHYTENGGVKTAKEVTKVGEGGLKAVDGTVTKIGKDGKTVVFKAADGTEHTFEAAGHASADAAKGIAKGTDKAGKTTAYYSEEAGKKVVHFFEKL